jgi:hypothetical protein
MRNRSSKLFATAAFLALVAPATPVLAEDFVEIVKVRPPSGVIRGVTDGEVSNRRGEYIEITVRYNLESDCPFTVGAGRVDGYWGLDPDITLPWVVDLLPNSDTSVIEHLLDEPGRGRVTFRWSFGCRPDSPDLVSGYVWSLGTSLNCSSGELDFTEPLLGLDYWVIDCSGS